MKLSEKICQCRKKNGYSQEVLAEKLGVSRQAVSKWETGESEPEIGKLRLLSQIFQVSTDWLLSDEGPEQVPEGQPAAEGTNSSTGPMNQLCRKLGRFAGIYLMAGGCILTALGGYGRWHFHRLGAKNQALWGTVDLAQHPGCTAAGIVAIAGLVVLAAGILVTVLTRRKRK